MFRSKRIGTLPSILKAPHVFVTEPTHNRIKKINQFTLVSKIGHGANAKVYLAFDTEAKKYYAAKAIKISPKGHSASSIEREIRIMRLLDHKNIVKLHSVLHDQINDVVYIIMEYGDAGSLQTYVSKQKLPETDIASVLFQVLQGLSYLHDQGIVHQDIKPSNILLFSDGKVKITDFGIGHDFGSAEEIIGTPAYQAPELLSDEFNLDPVKMDIYSLV